MPGRSPSNPDIFISYSHHDRDLVAKAIAAFEAHGLTVWWDEKIHQIRWDHEIEDMLEACSYIVAFVTENAVSSRLDFVFSEMRYGREREKLVPMRIGEFRMPFAFEGVTSLVQNYFFSSNENIVTSQQFRRVCRACGAELDGEGPELRPPATPWDRVDQWFKGKVTADDVSFALALAFLEHAPLIQVQQASNELLRVIDKSTATGSGNGGSSQSAGQPLPFLTPRSARLQAVEAVVYETRHPRLSVSQEYCRFQDGERPAALVGYAWRELDRLRTPLVQWLDHQAGTLPGEGRMRIALALGCLAQADFASVFDQILRRWLTDEHGARRETADMALSVASFEPEAGKAIQTLIGDWAGTSSPSLLRVALELACGYTGMRIPGLPIKTLTAVSKSKVKDFQLIVTMKDAIRQLLANAAEMDDNSLLDLPQLIDDLAAWVESRHVKAAQASSSDNKSASPGTAVAPSGQPLWFAGRRSSSEHDRLPMLLFLATLGELPVTNPAGVPGALSLTALMSNERTRAACARVISAALRDTGDDTFDPREQAREILRRWAEKQARRKGSDDPVLLLARELWQSNPQQRDKDRIIHLFRKQYSLNDLSAETPEK